MGEIHCWFSGGRDSAVACKLAHDVAQIRDFGFKLIHIDTTTPRPRNVNEYIRAYADWMGADLIILRPPNTFRELAEKYPYWPALKPDRYRWCYHLLKQAAVVNFLEDNRDALSALHVFAVRRDESLFREREYTETFTRKCYNDNLCIRVWLPLLYADDMTINALIKKWNIPTSPVWGKLGYSGECQCLAGTSYNTLLKLYIHYPEVVEELAEIDDVIQSNRKRAKEPSYPVPLRSKKMTLREWLEKMKKQPRLTDFIATEINNYVGKACQGSCMFPES